MSCPGTHDACIVYAIAYLGPILILTILFLFQRLQYFMGHGCCGRQLSGSTPQECQEGERGNSENSEVDGRPPKSGWPPSLQAVFSHHRVTIFYIAFLVCGYILIQATVFLPCCTNCRAQARQNHVQNMVELLGRGLLLYWLGNFCVAESVGLAKMGVALVYELICTVGFFAHCSGFMSESLTTGRSALNPYDLSLSAIIWLNILSLFSCARCEFSFKAKVAYFACFGFLLFGHAVILTGLTGLKLHLHHYHLGTLLGIFCAFNAPFARLCLVKCIGLLMEGIGIWGADPIILCCNMEPVPEFEYASQTVCFTFLGVVLLGILLDS